VTNKSSNSTTKANKDKPQMTFHDQHRLAAHLEEVTGLTLNSGQRKVADYVAHALNPLTGTMEFSASYIARETGFKQRKSVEQHLKFLRENKIFNATRRNERKGFTYSLNIPCPQTCNKLKQHNHSNRLALLAKASVVDNSDQMSSFSDQMSSFYSTNRTKYIDIDIDKVFQFSTGEVLEVITATLNNLEQLGYGHNQLLKHLDLEASQQVIAAKALDLLSNPNIDKPELYLAKVVTATPKRLYEQLEPKAIETKQVETLATIHTPDSVKARVTLEKVRGYTSKQLGYEMTEASQWFLRDKLKQGLAITWKDLVISEVVERHNLDLFAKGTDTDKDRLQIELRNGLPKVYFEVNYPSWDSRAVLAEQHLATLREQLTDLYNRLPDQVTLEAYDLEAWLINNYTIEQDQQEFLKNYPTKPEGITWDSIRTSEALLLAFQKGYTLEQLKAKASELPRNSSTWATWKQHPHTWLNNLEPLTSMPRHSDLTDPQAASIIEELTLSFKLPQKASKGL
jgi:hypothetical protein